MTIEPDWIRQNQEDEFTITFNQDPPWIGETGGTFYITRFELGDDIEYTTIYKGLRTVPVTLHALPNAKVDSRKLELTATYEKFGQKQQTHSGWCWLFVLPRQTLDGGNQDGGD